MKNQHIILLVVALGLAPLAALPDAEPLKPQTKNVKDNMGWSGWEEFRNLTPNDKTNLQEQRWNQDRGEASLALRATRNRNAG